MKKYYIALCAVCFGMAFTACSNDENEVVKNEGAPLTEIFASAKVATRTALAENGVDVTWSAGDAISVFPLTGVSGTKSFTFVQTGQAGQSSSKFFGKADECDKYVSVYPANSSLVYKYMGGDGWSVSNITIPTEQHAVKGGFDPKASIMAATFTQATAGEVEFKHMCAFAKITTTQPCKSITFTPTGDGNWRVTGGDFYLQFNTVGSVSNVHATHTKGNIYAKLLPASGQTEIEAGTYYIAFNPAPAGTSNSEGITKFVIENSDGTQLTRSADKKTKYGISTLGKVIDFGTAKVSEGWTLN